MIIPALLCTARLGTTSPHAVVTARTPVWSGTDLGWSQCWTGPCAAMAIVTDALTVRQTRCAPHRSDPIRSNPATCLFAYLLTCSFVRCVCVLTDWFAIAWDEARQGEARRGEASGTRSNGRTRTGSVLGSRDLCVGMGWHGMTWHVGCRRAEEDVMGTAGTPLLARSGT